MKPAVTAAPAAAPSLPDLTPVLVATDDEGIEDTLRAARAEVARLALSLRAVRAEVEAAEKRASDAQADAVFSDLDLPGARTFLAASLGASIDDRRAELRAELEAARRDAARVVASAQRRADAYIAAAHDAALSGLLQPSQPVPPLAPLPPALLSDDDDAVFDTTGPTVARAEAGSEVPVERADGDLAGAGIAAILTALQPVIAGQVAVPAPGAGTAATMRVSSTPKPPGPSLGSRLLFADVLLPLIAVVVVLVVLFAWVG